MQRAFKFDLSAEALAKTDPASAKLPKVEYDFPAAGETSNGIVLVGEAPGAEEARLGRPFVGRSGQLLDKSLAQAGIERKQCLVANAFRFQPPGNKIDHFFLSRRAAKERDIAIAEEFGQFGSAWCRKEFASELAHLRDTLIAYQNGVIPGRAAGANPESHVVSSGKNKKWDSGSNSPTPEAPKNSSGMTKLVIIALGRTALWALTGENGLMEKLGKPLPCRLLPGVCVIPTFHPSFILRGNWARQNEWLGHFAAAIKIMH
jgi:DNA polymerase